MKYKLHYIIVMPAIALLLLFKGLPLWAAVQIAFRDYSPFQGLLGSEFVGLRNFQQLFNDPAFFRVLMNTLVFKCAYIFLCGAVALLVALALSSIKSGKLRELFGTLFLLPYFIPTIVIAYFTILVLSTQSPFFNMNSLWLMDAAIFRPLVIVIEVLRTLGIPVVIALAAIYAKQAAIREQEQPLSGGASYAKLYFIPALKAIAAFMLLQLSSILTTNFELLYLLANPLVYETGDMLEAYLFRTGFMNAQFSMAGALWLMQFIVQLACAILAYLLLRTLFVPTLFTGNNSVSKAAEKSRASSVPGLIAASIFAIPAVLLLYLLFIYPFTAPAGTETSVWSLIPLKSLIIFFMLYLMATVVHLMMTVTLAYPLTVKKLPGRNLYKLFLLLFLTAGAGSIHEYLLFRELSMVGTVFPNLFHGFFGIISVFVLKSIFNARYGELKQQYEAQGRGELHAFLYLYLPNIWKPLLALGIIQFITLWNSYTTSLIYTANPELHSPAMRFMTLMNNANAQGMPYHDPAILFSAAVISLPSIALFLLFRKWITSEVLVSQGRKL